LDKGDSIVTGIDECKKVWSNKEHVDVKVMNEWSCTLKEKISKIIKSKHIAPICKKILNDKSVRTELMELQKKFVFVPTDKAQNNIAIICKKFYLDSLLKEVAFTDTKNTENKNMTTYVLQDITQQDIITKHIKDLKSFKITIPDEQLKLPFLFWIPKCTNNFQNKGILLHLIRVPKNSSSILTKILKLIYKSHKVYCKAIESYTGFNFMWIIQNSLELHQTFNYESKINNLKTYDFSTLYTSIP